MANRGDLLGDLVPGQHAALARLRALRQLDLDAAHRRRRVERGEQRVHRETAVEVAAAEVAGPDLIHEVGAELVIRRDAAFAGVVVAAGELRAAVQRLGGVRAERAVAHRGDVDDRCRLPRLRAAVGLAERARGRDLVHDVVRRAGEALLAVREHRVLDDRIADRKDLVVGAEAEVVVLAVRRSVDPVALVAIERQLLAVVGDDVLTELGAELDEEIPEVAGDREIPDDAVVREPPIVDEERHESGAGNGRKRRENSSPRHGVDDTVTSKRSCIARGRLRRTER